MSSDDKMSAGLVLWIAWTVGAVVVLSVVGGLISGVIGLRGEGASLRLIALIQVGAWQWLYVIPLLISLRRKQRFQTAKGLLIVACVLFGIDVLCSGVLIYTLGHTSFH